MKVLLVEPFGHIGGHYAEYTRDLCWALAEAGADVTLLTFDGLRGHPTEFDARVTHVTLTAKPGILAPMARLLPRLCPLKSVRISIDRISSTIATFSRLLRLMRKDRYHVIHILDACLLDYAFHCFAAMVNRHSLVFTLHGPSRETTSDNLRARLRAALSKKQMGAAFQMWLETLIGTRFATTLRKLLYKRASRRNRLAFVCHTRIVQDSFINSPLYRTIVCMPYGVAPPRKQTLSRVEARQNLNLPPNEAIFLHFGGNHLLKNLEVIFQAFQGLAGRGKLLFVGEFHPSSSNEDPRWLAQHYGLEKDTIFIDKYLPYKEAYSYFYAADAVILSHRKGFHGASGVLATAAHFTRPVIAARVADTEELVRDFGLGLLFEPENPESLRDALAGFLSLSNEERELFKSKLAEYALSHSYEEVARRHIELYRRLTQNSSTSNAGSSAT